MSKLPALTPKKSLKFSKRRVLYWIGLKAVIISTTTLKLRVVVPPHKKDLPKGTLLEILKQAGISKDGLRNLL